MINGYVAYSISHQTWLHVWSPGPPLAQQSSILSIAKVCKPVDDLHNPDQCDQCPTRLAHFMNLWVSHYASVWVCDAGSSQVRKGRTTEPDAAVQLTSDRALCCSTAALNRPRHVPPFFAKRRLRAKGVFTDYSESRHGSLPSVAGSSRHLQSCFDCASVPRDDSIWQHIMKLTDVCHDETWAKALLPETLVCTFIILLLRCSSKVGSERWYGMVKGWCSAVGWPPETAASPSLHGHSGAARPLQESSRLKSRCDSHGTPRSKMIQVYSSKIEGAYLKSL